MEIISIDDVEEEKRVVEEFVAMITDDESLSANKKELITTMFDKVLEVFEQLANSGRMSVKVGIVKLNPDAIIPQYAHSTDAGADICAVEETKLEPGETKIVKTGIAVAIPAGYLIDKIYKPVLRDVKAPEKSEEGAECVGRPSKREVAWHSLKHTFEIFIFILIITLILNFIFDGNKIVDFYQNGVLTLKYVQPIITAFIGLIPNCAVSVAITVLMLKGTITFGAAMAGLLSNGGLGLLVLLRGGRLKNNLRIVIILLLISIISS
jgi:hypothetical protein